MKNKYLLSQSSFKNNSVIFSFILLIFITSCNKLPQDLQDRKNAINKTNQELPYQEVKANSSSDYKQLVTDYTNLRNELVSYTADCNSRGISKVNDKLVNICNEKISKYEKLSESSTKTEEVCSRCNGNRVITTYSYNGCSDVSHFSLSDCVNDHHTSSCTGSGEKTCPCCHGTGKKQ